MDIVIIDRSEPASLRLGSLVAGIKGIDNIIQVFDKKQIFSTLEKLKPHVIIFDLNMNGRNCISILSKIHGLYPEILIIALTSVNPDQYRRTCKKYGIQYCVDKVNDFDEIQKIIVKNRKLKSHP
jgi:DNA-binding NarL/FixJ family response regulator